MDFSDSVVACDIKVDLCNQLNFYKYQRSRSFADLCLGCLIFSIFNFLFSNTARLTETKRGASIGWENESLCMGSGSHDQEGHLAHIW